MRILLSNWLFVPESWVKTLLMKSLFTLTVVGILFSVNAHAVQFFQCWNLPLDIDSTDRTVISLTSATEGTLFLSSGIDDDGNQDSTGPLKLVKGSTSGNSTVWTGKNTSSTFTVTIPNAAIGKTSNAVTLDLDLKNVGNHSALQVSCYSRMY